MGQSRRGCEGVGVVKTYHFYLDNLQATATRGRLDGYLQAEFPYTELVAVIALGHSTV